MVRQITPGCRFFLAKTGILNLEGGFMVLYNRLRIERVKDNKCRYKKDDYHNLDEFYKQRIQQIHIIGKYANMRVSDKKRAIVIPRQHSSQG